MRSFPNSDIISIIAINHHYTREDAIKIRREYSVDAVRRIWNELNFLEESRSKLKSSSAKKNNSKKQFDLMTNNPILFDFMKRNNKTPEELNNQKTPQDIADYHVQSLLPRTHSSSPRQSQSQSINDNYQINNIMADFFQSKQESSCFACNCKKPSNYCVKCAKELLSSQWNSDIDYTSRLCEFGKHNYYCPKCAEKYKSNEEEQFDINKKDESIIDQFVRVL